MTPSAFRLASCEPHKSCCTQVAFFTEELGFNLPHQGNQYENRRSHCSPWSLSPDNGETNGATVETLPCERNRARLMERAKMAGGSDRNGGKAVGQKVLRVLSWNLLACWRAFFLTAMTLGSSQLTSFYWVRTKTDLVINTTWCLLCLYRCT